MSIEEEGSIGTSLKKRRKYVFDCSDIDDIITFQNGTMKVVKVEVKLMEKNIVHVGVSKRRQTYCFLIRTS